ncbi:hypothetical protein TREES_T100012119 [Tupaia chinensis]|uniref:Uncharacterized protein n=1 Tax=Tupaia chinensis TaxID=246437 RepID=L9K087_TUPCH|nr:hypothetical protein TREES_T100012119 [Tupaia chinensis]
MAAALLAPTTKPPPHKRSPHTHSTPQTRRAEQTSFTLFRAKQPTSCPESFQPAWHCEDMLVCRGITNQGQLLRSLPSHARGAGAMDQQTS